MQLGESLLSTEHFKVLIHALCRELKEKYLESKELPGSLHETFDQLIGYFSLPLLNPYVK